MSSPCASRGAAAPLTLLLCACAATGAGSADFRAAVGEPFRLAPGETARLDGGPLLVRFDSVEADSRCPAEVTCVWEGTARVALTVRATGGVREVVLNSAADPRVAEVSGYRLTLDGVTPEPRAAVEIAPGEYRVTLRILASNDQQERR